jgi:hypothetical protein
MERIFLVYMYRDEYRDDGNGKNIFFITVGFQENI